MLLVDFTQLVISAIISKFKEDGEVESFVNDAKRHKMMVLMVLRSYLKKFKKEFGNEVIICCDNENYWRRAVFPEYKYNRRQKRINSLVDWDMIFDTVRMMKNDLKENFPYKVIDVDGAEADDIIATLCSRFAHNGKILILSGDKDFFQLHRDENIHQYSPLTKTFIENNKMTADEFLAIKVLKGDSSDGIPNFLSMDNVYVVNEGRQKPLTKKKMKEYIDHPSLAEREPGYKRNSMLIDFKHIPEKITKQIIQEYDTPLDKKNSKGKIMQYLTKHRMAELVEDIGDF